jgi:hypothetical protein
MLPQAFEHVIPAQLAFTCWSAAQKSPDLGRQGRQAGAVPAGGGGSQKRRGGLGQDTGLGGMGQGRHMTVRQLQLDTHAIATGWVVHTGRGIGDGQMARAFGIGRQPQHFTPVQGIIRHLVAQTSL